MALNRSLGSVIGLSLSATVIQQTLRTQLRRQLKSGKDADRIIRKVRENLEYIKALEPETRDIVRHCYGAAIRNGLGFMLGAVSLAMLSSCMSGRLHFITTKLRKESRVHSREEAQQIGVLHDLKSYLYIYFSSATKVAHDVVSILPNDLLA